MHHVVVERWSRGASPLHHRDARAKIVVVLALLIAVAAAPPGAWRFGAAYAALITAAILVAGLPLAAVVGRAAMVLPFATAVAAASWIAGDRMRAAAALWKSYASATTVLVLIGTTPLPLLLDGFERLGAPRMLITVVQFLYRYLFVISEQAQHMRLAAACRGARGLAGFRAASGAVAVLFARSLARAEAIHGAMLNRGFTGRLRTGSPSRFSLADLAFVTAGLAGCCTLWLIR